MRDATLPPLRPKWPLSRSTAVSDPRVAPLPPPACAMRRVHDKRLPRRETYYHRREWRLSRRMHSKRLFVDAPPGRAGVSRERTER